MKEIAIFSSFLKVYKVFPIPTIHFFASLPIPTIKKIFGPILTMGNKFVWGSSLPNFTREGIELQKFGCKAPKNGLEAVLFENFAFFGTFLFSKKRI